MEKCIYIFVIIFFVVIVPIALCLILKPVFEHNKLLNGVVNYDTFMRKYVFRIDLSKEEFLAQLKIRNINDPLEYYLSDDCTIIVFTMYNTKYRYNIMIDEFTEFIVLRVEQISTLSKASYLINAFFVKKFNAKPIDYQKYVF